jgi:hypothetical protein
MGPICCPETSVLNQPTLRNNPEDERTQWFDNLHDIFLSTVPSVVSSWSTNTCVKNTGDILSGGKQAFQSSREARTGGGDAVGEALRHYSGRSILGGALGKIQVT